MVGLRALSPKPDRIRVQFLAADVLLHIDDGESEGTKVSRN